MKVLIICMLFVSCAELPLSYSTVTDKYDGEYYSIIEFSDTATYYDSISTRIEMSIKGNFVSYIYGKNQTYSGEYVIDDWNKVYQGNKYYKNDYLGYMNFSEDRDTLIFSWYNGSYSWYKRKDGSNE